MLTASGKSFLRGRLEAATAEFAGNFYFTTSGDTTATNLSDVSLPGEYTTNGLGRQVCTFSHVTGSNAWTATVTVTFTGTSATPVNKIALFDAASGGNLICEYLLATPTTFSNSGDNASFSISLSL